MNKKLQQKLFRKYPLIFQDRFKTGDITRMCDGICCGDGWYELIDEVCEQLNLLGKHFGILVTFFQVKEKFAGLRLYINRPEINPDFSRHRPCLRLSPKQKNTLSKIVRKIIHYGECQSYRVCDTCGESRYGHKRYGAWLYAMCDNCWKKFKKNERIKIPRRKKH